MSALYNLQPELQSIVVWVAFFFATLLIDSYDISLPRGDSIAMSGPLIALAIVEFGVVPALAMGLTSSIVIQSIRRLRNRESATLDEVVLRLGATSLAGIAAYGLLTVSMSAVSVFIVPAVYLLSELIGRQMLLARHRGRSLRRLIAGNVSRQALLFAAELSVAALAILTYDSMGGWSAIPVVALLLLMRQAYSMLLEIRETYLNTVSVLVEAAESQTPGLSGHGGRTAAIARAIGAECGLSSADIERVSYAALLHDIGRIADYGEQDITSVDSASLLEEVTFFDHVVPILHVTDGVLPEGSAQEHDLVAGFIVALSSDIDSASHLEARQLGAGSRVTRVSPLVPARLKAQVVAAAVGLGHSVPAID